MVNHLKSIVTEYRSLVDSDKKVGMNVHIYKFMLVFYILGSNDVDVTTLDMSNSAFYQSVCVEMEMSSLAINTIVQSHHVNDMEGETLIIHQ